MDAVNGVFNDAAPSEEGAMTLDRAQLGIGGIFVLVSAWSRFNTPSTNRSSTTFFRFASGLILYVAASLLFYSVLAFSQDVLQPMLQEIHPPKFVSSLSSPFVAALLLTVLLPRVPLLNEIDSRARSSIHRLVSIPTEALRLSRRIAATRTSWWTFVRTRMRGSNY